MHYHTNYRNRFAPSLLHSAYAYAQRNPRAVQFQSSAKRRVGNSNEVQSMLPPHHRMRVMRQATVNATPPPPLFGRPSRRQRWRWRRRLPQSAPKKSASSSFLPISIVVVSRANHLPPRPSFLGAFCPARSRDDPPASRPPHPDPDRPLRLAQKDQVRYH